MNEDLCINETIEQIRMLEARITQLELPQSRKGKYLADLKHIEEKLGDEDLDMDSLKLQLTVRLQQELVEHEPSHLMDTYSRVLNIYYEVQSRMGLTLKTARLKVMATLLDYRLTQRQKCPANLHFIEALAQITESGIWEVLVGIDEEPFVLFLLLGLMLQHLEKQQLEEYGQTHGLLQDTLLKSKSIHSRQAESHFRLLLQLHLSHKLAVKHIPFMKTSKSTERKIYLLLCEIDYNQVERVTYQYRRKTDEDHDEALQYIESRLRPFMDQYDYSSTKYCEMFSNKKPKKTVRIRRQSIEGQIKFQAKSLSTKSIKSTKSIGKRGSSLQIKNKMFVPETNLPDLQLKRRVEFRRKQEDKKQGKRTIGSKRSQFTLKSMKSAEYQSSQVKSKLSIPRTNSQVDSMKSIKNAQTKSKLELKPRNRAVTYEESKKSAVSHQFQMDMMFCRRPNLKSSYGAGNLASQIGKDEEALNLKRSPSKKKTMLKPKRNGLLKLKRTIVSKLQDCQEGDDLRVPLFMRDIFQTYLVSFNSQIHYQAMKLQLPLYQQLMHLKTNVYYYIRGHTIRFLSISQTNLNLSLKYVNSRQVISKQIIDLKASIEEQDVLGQLPPLEKQRSIIWGIYRLGREIVIFQLKLAIQSNNDYCAFSAELVIEREIMVNTMKITYMDLRPRQILKIIARNQQYIDELNKDAQIEYFYPEPKPTPMPVTVQFVPNRFQVHEWIRNKVTSQLKLVEKGNFSIKWKDQFTERIKVKQYYHYPSKRYYLSLLCKPFNKKINKNMVLSIRPIKLLHLEIIKDFSTFRKRIIPFLLNQSWDDIQMNKPLSLPSVLDYCYSLEHGYSVIRCFYFNRDYRLLLGTANKRTRKWFVIMHWSDLLTNSFNSILAAKSKKSLRSQIRIFQTVPAQIAQSSQSYILKHASVDDENLSLDGREYRLQYYDYCWPMRTKWDYICLRHSRQVMMLKNGSNDCLYVSKNNFASKSQDQYYLRTKKILKQRMEVKVYFASLNSMVTLVIRSNQIIMRHSDFEDHCYMITVHSSELSILHASFPLTPKLIASRSFKKRVVAVLEEKMYDYQSKYIYDCR